ncbi:hypothetical protein ABZ590_10255 [Streptomyces hirsutus]|uniref:hypothetical protein n=1 Tax=Streptomyces hirsutus TaxID=35620 RepID=UPI0033F1DC99
MRDRLDGALAENLLRAGHAACSYSWIKFAKKQKPARKPLNKAMDQLSEAVARQDWRAARTARSAAWGEVNKLVDEPTREERRKLWEYKQRILAGEAQKWLRPK